MRLRPSLRLAAIFPLSFLFACGGSGTNTSVDGATGDANIDDGSGPDAREADGAVDDGAVVDASGDGGHGPGWSIAVRQFGTGADDEALDVLIGEDGTLHVAGYEDGNVNDANVTPTGDARAIVRQYDVEGRHTSTLVLDTPGTDVAEAILVVNDDGVGIVGRTTGALLGTEAKGAFDGFVVSLFRSGLSRVHARWGNAAPQHPRHVARDGSGGVLVAGYDDLHVMNSTVIDDENGTLSRIRLGTNAGVEWEHRPTLTSNPDRILGLATDPISHASFVTGFRLLDDAEGEAGAYVRRIDADGSVVWTTFVASAGTMGSGVALAPSGDVIVVGTTLLALGDDVNVARGEDVFVASLDADTGVVRFVRQTGTELDDRATDVLVAVDGTLFIVGDTSGTFPGATSRGDVDVFVLRCTGDGAWGEALQRGSTARDRSHAIARDAHGRIFVVGSTEGAFAAPSLGGRDAFVWNARF